MELEEIEVEILNIVQRENPTEFELWKKIGKKKIPRSRLNVLLRGLENNNYIDMEQTGRYFLESNGAKQINLNPRDVQYPAEKDGQNRLFRAG